MVVHLDIVQITFEGQAHRSKFNVTVEKQELLKMVTTVADSSPESKTISK